MSLEGLKKLNEMNKPLHPSTNLEIFGEDQSILSYRVWKGDHKNFFK